MIKSKYVPCSQGAFRLPEHSAGQLHPDQIDSSGSKTNNEITRIISLTDMATAAIPLYHRLLPIPSDFGLRTSYKYYPQSNSGLRNGDQHTPGLRTSYLGSSQRGVS